MKEKILEDFKKTFPEIECSAHERTSSALCICEELSDINEENRNYKFFLSSALDRYAREVIEEIKPRFNVDTYNMSYAQGYNECISEIQKRADELLG